MIPRSLSWSATLSTQIPLVEVCFCVPAYITVHLFTLNSHLPFWSLFTEIRNIWSFLQIILPLPPWTIWYYLQIWPLHYSALMSDHLYRNNNTIPPISGESHSALLASMKITFIPTFCFQFILFSYIKAINYGSLWR